MKSNRGGDSLYLREIIMGLILITMLYSSYQVGYIMGILEGKKKCLNLIRKIREEYN